MEGTTEFHTFQAMTPERLAKLSRKELVRHVLQHRENSESVSAGYKTIIITAEERNQSVHKALLEQRDTALAERDKLKAHLSVIETNCRAIRGLVNELLPASIAAHSPADILYGPADGIGHQFEGMR